MFKKLTQASALATTCLVSILGSPQLALTLPSQSFAPQHQSLLQQFSDPGFNALKLADSQSLAPQQLAYGYRGSRLSWRVYPRPSRYRIGGFSRSSQCFDDNQTVTALTPPSRVEERIGSEQAAVDSTLASHPVFWLHVPQTQPTKAFFSLQKADSSKEEDLYSTTIELSGQAGIIGIKLPESLPGLDKSQTYLWQVLIQCEPDSYAGALHLGSWIERLDPEKLTPQDARFTADLANRLANSSIPEKALIYADLGIWQDTISTLAELRYRDPQNLEVQADWTALLTANRMQSFIQSPILNIF